MVWKNIRNLMILTNENERSCLYMCGIVGYVGKKDCTKVLLDSLSKLEYRGYDSAGIAVFENDAIKTKKTKGRLADLEEKA